MFGKKDFWQQADTKAEFRRVGRVLADWDVVMAHANAYPDEQRRDVAMDTRFDHYEGVKEKLSPKAEKLPHLTQTVFNRIMTEADFPLYPLVEYLGIIGNGRVNMQLPGQAFVMHVDNMRGPKIVNPTAKDEDFIRFQCAMAPRRWGHVYKFGDVQWDWEVGDVVWFDWQNAAHGTANIDEVPRFTYQITGLMTDRTREILEATKTAPFKLDLRAR